MKSDQYLNLCLDQAAMSSLHYRHGCVVVKGGKVIGQGFNDCRPGYDGGSVLKTGVLPKSAANVKPDKPDPPKSKSNFKTVESIVGNCGGGHHANARLTLHSEMMAINSALSSCSTLAASTVSHVKPSFKLLGDSKRKRALQRDAVLAYTRSVCLATFGPQVQQGAGPAEAVGSRYQYQKEKAYNNKYDKYKYKAAKRPQHVPAPRQTAQDSENAEGDLDDSGVKVTSQNATGSDKNNFGLRKASRIVRLIPRIKERTKHPKLVGADVYVARLANDGPASPIGKKKKSHAHDNPSDGIVDTTSPDTCTTSATSASTGSLHDELITKTSKPKPLTPAQEYVRPPPTAAESRPCYRCVAYMHSVGIKRVFWTNNDGSWECAKIRDLIDQLDGTMRSGTDTTLGQAATGVFVTKHEVLMLQRLIMSGQGRSI
ncbi:hypothetical protein DHEL01_v200858 [Diaporthe helianthi]|uniref:Uncharacterized protein n=1 Tax=Diaporthe helianthi TaxID=158607 RepID=A0A2P5IE47_DIAHE|nr:hypothetical protein DHEL01_v200858 [Diaporthe helianthi]